MLLIVIHRQFQHDLYRLRLETARNYVKALTGRHDPISTTTQEPLRLSAQVCTCHVTVLVMYISVDRYMHVMY